MSLTYSSGKTTVRTYTKTARESSIYLYIDSFLNGLFIELSESLFRPRKEPRFLSEAITTYFEKEKTGAVRFKY